MPCLNPNDSKVMASRAFAALFEPLMDDVAQLVHAHARRVDHEIGGVHDGLEDLALLRHRLAQVEVVAAHRVLAAGLGEPPQQLVFAGDQEQHLALDAAAFQLVDEPRHRGDLRGGVARVETDGRAVVGALRRTHGVRDEGLQQRGRNVIDAVEAQVLQHVESHALTGTRQGR